MIEKRANWNKVFPFVFFTQCLLQFSLLTSAARDKSTLKELNTIFSKKSAELGKNFQEPAFRIDKQLPRPTSKLQTLLIHLVAVSSTIQLLRFFFINPTSTGS